VEYLPTQQVSLPKRSVWLQLSPQHAPDFWKYCPLVSWSQVPTFQKLKLVLQGRRVTFQRSRSAQPGTPHPRAQGQFLGPGNNSNSPALFVPNPEIQFQSWTQENPNPAIPFLHRQLGPLPAVEHSSSSPEAVTPVAVELYYFYPEQIYLSTVLPTCNPRETREFKAHCREVWDDRTHTFVVHEHPLSELNELSTRALNFQNLLWKIRTTLSNHGITEEYAHICQQIWPNSIDRPILEPAFRVFYPWNQPHWMVSPT